MDGIAVLRDHGPTPGKSCSPPPRRSSESCVDRLNCRECWRPSLFPSPRFHLHPHAFISLPLLSCAARCRQRFSRLVRQRRIKATASRPLRLDADTARPLRDDLAAILINNLVALRRNHVSRVSHTGASNGGFGTLLSVAAPADSDRDGMPDAWETALGFNPGADDHNNVFANSGGVITAAAFSQRGRRWAARIWRNTCTSSWCRTGPWRRAPLARRRPSTIDLRKWTSGFANAPVFTLSEISGGVANQSGTGGALVHFVPTPNLVGRARFDIKVMDAEGSAWTQQCALLVSASGAPRNLVWKGDNAVTACDATAAT